MGQALGKPCPQSPKRLFWLDGFLTASQCGAILEELDFTFWEPSKVYVQAQSGGYQHVQSGKRISSSTSERWFNAPLRRRMTVIERRIGVFLPTLASHREEWQATRYARGGRFGYHFDSGYFGQEAPGERTHSVLIYLDTPRRGGATRFPRLDVEVKSVAGRLVIWKNLDADGQPDPDMLHASLPLLEGRKTTLVTWMRQRACLKVKAKGRP